MEFDKTSVQPSKSKVMTSSSLCFKSQFSSAVANDWTKYLSMNIVGNVSLNFVDSFYFEEFIQKIKPNWIVPSPTTFMDTCPTIIAQSKDKA